MIDEPSSREQHDMEAEEARLFSRLQSLEAQFYQRQSEIEEMKVRKTSEVDEKKMEQSSFITANQDRINAANYEFSKIKSFNNAMLMCGLTPVVEGKTSLVSFEHMQAKFVFRVKLGETAGYEYVSSQGI
jgi:hypothetical protein